MREIPMAAAGVGARVMPAALALCEWLLHLEGLPGARVLELGAGAGAVPTSAAQEKTARLKARGIVGRTPLRMWLRAVAAHAPWAPGAPDRPR